MTWINDNCDGSGPHTGHDVKVYPLGAGGNLILCCSCWRRENLYRKDRGQETGQPELWPQENWADAITYADKYIEA